MDNNMYIMNCKYILSRLCTSAGIRFSISYLTVNFFRALVTRNGTMSFREHCATYSLASREQVNKPTTSSFLPYERHMSDTSPPVSTPDPKIPVLPVVGLSYFSTAVDRVAREFCRIRESSCFLGVPDLDFRFFRHNHIKHPMIQSILEPLLDCRPLPCRCIPLM